MTDRTQLIIAGSACALLALTLAYGVYRYVALDDAAQVAVQAKADADAHIEDLTRQLEETERERDALAAAFGAERAKTGTFEQQISEISGTVGTLAKLANTDPELLTKYSKVFFLNENYTPSSLDAINKTYLSDPSRTLEFHADALPHLEDLIEEAKEDGVELRVASAYRSFGTQAALKGRYLVTYGAGANRFSADQGYSEHQLGTTIDFTTPALGSGFTSFGGTQAYTWLVQNAHRYGFVLSYPEGNTYYQYEPWHWRYVGEQLARDLDKKDLHFYDLDQREIDEYLVDLF